MTKIHKASYEILQYNDKHVKIEMRKSKWNRKGGTFKHRTRKNNEIIIKTVRGRKFTMKKIKNKIELILPFNIGALVCVSTTATLQPFTKLM